MTQLTYLTVPADPAFAGGLVDNSTHDILSRVAGEDLPFGVAVCRISDGEVELPDNAADIIIGVTVRSDTYDNSELAGDDAIPEDAVAGVMRQGKVWVIVQDACVEGGQVFVRLAGAEQHGGFAGTDDGADTALLAGARWGSTQASADGLAILILDGLTGAMS